MSRRCGQRHWGERANHGRLDEGGAGCGGHGSGLTARGAKVRARGDVRLHVEKKLFTTIMPAPGAQVAEAAEHGSRGDGVSRRPLPRRVGKGAVVRTAQYRARAVRRLAGGDQGAGETAGGLRGPPRGQGRRVTRRLRGEAYAAPPRGREGTCSAGQTCRDRSRLQ